MYVHSRTITMATTPRTALVFLPNNDSICNTQGCTNVPPLYKNGSKAKLRCISCDDTFKSITISVQEFNKNERDMIEVILDYVKTKKDEETKRVAAKRKLDESHEEVIKRQKLHIDKLEAKVRRMEEALLDIP